MTVLLLVLALALIGATTALLARAAGQRRREAVAVVAEIGRYGFSSRHPHDGGRGSTAARTSLLPRFDLLAEQLGGIVSRRAGPEAAAEVAGLLRSAGIYRTSARKVLGYRVLLTLGLPVLWLVAAQGQSPLSVAIGLVFTVALGWAGPIAYLRRRARTRLDAIDNQVPDMIDLLVITIEAGVGFTASLQIAAERFAAPLGDELRVVVAEHEMGLTIEEALEHLLERVDTPALRAFIRAVVQGQRLGVSIGRIMRDVADEMRKRRRQKAEERAHKAPTKMMFPLVLLIFPALFVVLLGPAIVSIVKTLHGS